MPQSIPQTHLTKNAILSQNKPTLKLSDNGVDTPSTLAFL